MDYGNANLSFAAALLENAVQRGLRHVVICPGSRSTPLALAAAVHPALTTHVLIDERSAAFFALGIARQLHEPVGLICTSGTAAANFAPAVIEAHLSRIPLLVLTADRPAELRDWGAAQTIDQVDLYGSHTRWSRDLPAPVGDPAESRHAKATAVRAMALASGPPAGPVHLNLQFREPLIPGGSDPPALIREHYLVASPERTPRSQAPAPAPADVEQLVNLTRSRPDGIIVCGPHAGAELGHAAAALSAATGYPCLADPLSTVRYAWDAPCGLIDAYDIFLREPGLNAKLAPELVIRVGGMPTSKPLVQFLSRQETPVIAIDPGSLRDAGHSATWHVRSDERATLEAVAKALDSDAHAGRTDWFSRWTTLNTRTSDAIASALRAHQSLSEPGVAGVVVDLLPRGGTLVVGNSMPVRDIDTFAAGGDRGIRVTGTRGAIGIDGVTSTVLGAAAVASGPVALLIGDLSFLHDLGGLQAAALTTVPVTIVVVNNNGGGIFSFLPQHNQVESALFETLFGTPAALDIQRAAAVFGCDYARPVCMDSFKHEFCHSLTSPGVTILEVRTNRDQNLALHREIAASALGYLAETNGS